LSGMWSVHLKTKWNSHWLNRLYHIIWFESVYA
jgi:hypothetical protein